MVTNEKRFSRSVRMDIEAQWKAISNLFDDFTRARPSAKEDRRH